METLEPCLPYVDIFMPSIIEAQHLTGLSDYREIAQFLRGNYDIDTVIIKMGENGSYAATPEAEHLAPAYPVDVVDATGAGDAYAAGFLAGTLMDWDLKATVELASATGAACVTAIGTTAGIQNLEETLKISSQRSAVSHQ
ncbi:MAG: PfkB family carbohydrate kinase, partial [Candidatus Poribacteria bacterium]|nr:PfkB family carbohydrate kinase [Candidatus Poribacteria bacterium]